MDFTILWACQPVQTNVPFDKISTHLTEKFIVLQVGASKCSICRKAHECSWGSIITTSLYWDLIFICNVLENAPVWLFTARMERRGCHHVNSDGVTKGWLSEQLMLTTFLCQHLRSECPCQCPSLPMHLTELDQRQWQCRSASTDLSERIAVHLVAMQHSLALDWVQRNPYAMFFHWNGMHCNPTPHEFVACARLDHCVNSDGWPHATSFADVAWLS